jgi:putative DNA primase/helicase
MNPAARAAHAVASRMGGGVQVSGGDYRVRCPVHEGEDRHLSIKNGTKGADIVVRCYSHECAPVDILRTITAMGGSEPPDRDAPKRERPAVEETPPQANANFGRAITMWRECRSLRDTLGERYLESRGIILPEGLDLNLSVRFHPRLRHPTGAWLPGIVCLVRDPLTNDALGIHRIFLNDDGTKTRLEPSRALLGGGGLRGVIKLIDDAEVTSKVEVAEGLETAAVVLSAAHAAGYILPPMWAAPSAVQFARLPMLPGIEVLVLHPDNDEQGQGQNAAHDVIDRWSAAGAACEYWVSLNPRGKDWNDLP